MEFFETKKQNGAAGLCQMAEMGEREVRVMLYLFKGRLYPNRQGAGREPAMEEAKGFLLELFRREAESRPKEEKKEK